ncbi:MAG: DUF523 domain-containing protein [Verrucomicrobia bacterium]|nr:DUF523 domain-containing protein [Verrucomicrobiota bacterium]
MCLVSACLAGVNCRHDGGNKLDPRIAKLVAEGRAIPVCPEQLGGLPTPRTEADIADGTGPDVLDGRARVVDREGQDVTAQFIRGAREALQIAKTAGATLAIFKENSPSCGCRRTYARDAGRKSRRVAGQGVTAALLSREGLRVISEEALDEQPDGPRA